MKDLRYYHLSYFYTTLKVYTTFRKKHYLHFQSCFYYLHLTSFLIGLILNLKMDETCYSETSDDFQWTTRSSIPEDITHHNLFYLKIHITSQIHIKKIKTL
jgi:hypothetical protein